MTFGTSESGFYYGVVAWFWYSLPYYFFIAFAALVIAPRLKRHGGAMTLSDILERHDGMPTCVVGAAACFFYSAPHSRDGGDDDDDAISWHPYWLGAARGDQRLRCLYDEGSRWADAISDTFMSC